MADSNMKEHEYNDTECCLFFFWGGGCFINNKCNSKFEWRMFWYKTGWERRKIKIYPDLANLFCQAQRDIFDEEFDRVDAGSLAIMLCWCSTYKKAPLSLAIMPCAAVLHSKTVHESRSKHEKPGSFGILWKLFFLVHPSSMQVMGLNWASLSGRLSPFPRFGAGWGLGLSRCWLRTHRSAASNRSTPKGMGSPPRFLDVSSCILSNLLPSNEAHLARSAWYVQIVPHFCVWWVGAEKCYISSRGCIGCLAGGFESVGEHGKSDRFLAVTRWLKDIQEQSAAHGDTCRMMETVRLRSSWPRERGEQQSNFYIYISIYIHRWFLSRGEAVQCLMWWYEQFQTKNQWRRNSKKTACTCVHFVHSDYFLLVPAVGLACMAKVKKQNLKKKVKARRSIRLSVVKRLLATLIGWMKTDCCMLADMGHLDI